ncbi:hypothetical protein [Chitinophaga agri]|uniref:Outer membrane protein beta-barrel domain-containing protein n=1 Tax=Chitinophaga agri TaxID=2703787 RepID=A0A6B9Z9X6_9BACT|nr:hypothetical protein [Chitinophaga agri]QHS59070.1 hypothetical protein GWR21_05510 [Chitinophaga agri]
MKRVFLLAAVCLAGITSSHAQRFINGIGTGVFVEGASHTNTKASTVFTYSPRISFAESENTSISVGIPLSVGFSATYNATYDSYYGWDEESMFGYMVNAPVMVNFNFGAGSAQGCQSRMGFYVGAGYGLHAGTVESEYYDPEYYGYYTDSRSMATTGPAANIGMRIGVGRKKRHNIEISTFYMKGITGDYKAHIGGLTCLFNF